MIPIFDLDDTLYPEITFVESGLRAVAAFGERIFGLDPQSSYENMHQTLEKQGRGRIFDNWLSEHGLLTKSHVAECVKTYRHHRPDIQIPAEHVDLLKKLGEQVEIYLVTDGHKIAQQRKVEALGIEPLFKRVFITHRFGVKHAKPSLYCFERIKEVENVDWSDLVYIGDNPAKDFVNLNKVGANTIRVHTGTHADVKAKPGYDAQWHVDRLVDVESILTKLDR